VILLDVLLLSTLLTIEVSEAGHLSLRSGLLRLTNSRASFARRTLQPQRATRLAHDYIRSRLAILLFPKVMRKIIHCDMDAFYASVEQRDDPRLRGKPVIVAWKGNRSVVCAASYEARAFGVRSAMPTKRAERLCPEGIFVAPDFTRYRAVSGDVREIFTLHTDLIEPLSLDEAYLDVTTNKTGLPTATLVARTIREQIRKELNLTASAGVAPNKFLAKLASDWKKPDGLFVIQPEEIDAFLLPLSVGRLPGVGKVNADRLAKLGVRTVRELRSLELSKLEKEFGRYGVRMYELSRGIDENPVVSDRPTQSISVEDTFQEDVLLEETEPMIRRLAEKLWSASRQEPRMARTVVLKLKTSEFKILTRSHTGSAPPSSCDELTEIALKLRERVTIDPQQRYRLVGVSLSNFREAEQIASQPALFE
jgi:DNA polymerase IV